MIIIAHEPPDRYLVDLEKNDMGVVIDNDVISVPFYIPSLLARGFWEDYTGTQLLLQDWKDELKNIEIPERGNV